MKRAFIFFLTAFFSMQIFAQSAEDSVKQAVNAMFTAMRNGDGPGLQNSFSSTAVLQTIKKDKEGTISVATEDIKEFVDFVSKQKKGAADERITFETIKIDGPLAIVWTPYKFYFESKFSHCGVNSFQLIRLKEGWKIQYIIDTRRKDGCQE